MLPKTVAIVGAGETGSALAALISLAGIQVTLVDVREDFLRAAMRNVNLELERLLAAEMIATEKKVDALDRVLTSESYASAARADLVFSTLPENESKKLNALAELDRVCSPAAVFCTSTCIISMETLAAAISNPARFAGVHFQKPVNSTRLAEVSRCKATSERTIEFLKEFLWFLGKVPVVLNASPGLVSRRMFFASLCEACRLLEEGVAGPADVDLAARLSSGGARAPLESADRLGLDVCLESLDSLYRLLNDPALKPPAVLAEKVRLGQLGVKSGKGFFEYK